MSDPRQLSIAFQPGTLEQYPDFMEVIRAAVLNSRRKRGELAADCDMSPSHFSRTIHESGDLALRARDLPALLDALPDTRHLILDWIVERWLDAPGDKVERAAAVVERALPALLEAVQTLTEYRHEAARQQATPARGSVSRAPGPGWQIPASKGREHG